MLAAAGGVLFVVPRLRKPSGDGESQPAVYGNVNVIIAVFSLTLLLGAVWGNGYMRATSKADAEELIDRHSVALAAEAARVSQSRELQLQHIENCSTKQYQLNAQRKEVGLEPVTIRQVCPDLPEGSPGQ